MKRVFCIISFIALWFISCNSDDNGGQQMDETTTIDLGQINAPLFEKKDEFNFLKNGEQNRIIKFSLNKYSKLSFDINGFEGNFSLFSITEKRYLTHNGGSLGGGSANLEIFQNFNYETELFEGEYEIYVNINSISFNENELIIGEYSLNIEDINDLIPYKNLGALDLYNATFVADDQRLSNTLYEFEILKDKNLTVFVDGNVCLNLPDLEIQTYLYNSQGERIGNDFISNVILKKDTYKLFFNGKRTLILNNPDSGDIDFGIISDFPKNIDFNVDMTYEPDSQKKFYFEILEEVAIDGLAFGNCNFEYRIIDEHQNFVFRKN